MNKYSSKLIKSNWSETRERFIGWWNQDDILISNWTRFKKDSPLDFYGSNGFSWQRFWTDPDYSADYNERVLQKISFPLDIYPVAKPYLGPGSLALVLGSKMGQSDQRSIWYEPAEFDIYQKPFQLDPENEWWKLHKQLVSKNLETSRGRYFVACPDLIENLDIMASLRGVKNIMMDMIERKEQVKDKLFEINQVYFDAYDEIYEMIKDQPEGACYGPFYLWAPGKVAKVQCDSAIMISPDMFEEFVLPPLKQQCQWLDYSMYHLDGSAQLRHLDHILSIETLNAIQWNPEPDQPNAGSLHWLDLYKKILESGKSVQIIKAKPKQVKPLVENLGNKGLYIAVDCDSDSELEELREVYK